MVKSFGSMKYEGSQARIIQNLNDNNYHNNDPGIDGWYIESGNTDLQNAGEMEFKEKEGKWFTYMKGTNVESISDLDSREFSFQGIGMADSISFPNGGETESIVYGCTDPLASNYNPNATIDDGSCLYNPPPLPVYGCTDPNATNYDSAATQDDGSCTYPPPPPIGTYQITVQDLGDQD